MNKFSYAYAALAVALVSTSIALAAPNPGTEKNMKQSETFKINAIGLSGQHGFVTLYPLSDKTRVTIAIVGEPLSANEPAHIHTGSCPAPGPVKWPLTNVVHGSSVTVLNVPMDQVDVSGLAVNIHRSPAQLAQYKACGNIKG